MIHLRAAIWPPSLCLLFDSVFLQNPEDFLFYGFGPQGVPIIGWMNAVDRSKMIGRSCVRIDVIDIFVFLACDLHQTVSQINTVLLELFGLGIEIAALPADGALEDQRFARMGRLQLLNKREETFVDLGKGRVGE